MARKYDPKTGTWKKVSDKKTSKSNNTSKSNTSKKKSNDTSGKTNSSKTNKNSSAGSSKKKSNKRVLNTLEGAVTVVPTPTTIKIKPAQTIKISGVGSQLSGKYYVKDVTRTISSSGLSISLTVIKTNFRETLKTTTKKISKKKKKK